MRNHKTKKMLKNMRSGVGIRATIDGRLRDPKSAAQAMDMAKSASNFITSNVKCPDGKPVKVIIGETVIGGAPEAYAVERQFAKEDVGVELTVTPFWCYGSETIDMNPTRPKAIMGKNGTERPGAVYLAAAAAGHDQIGLPVFKLYGRDIQDVGDSSIPVDLQDKLLNFIKTGLAVATMKDKSYLAVGGTSMGIAGSRMNHDFFQDSLGMRVEEVDMSEVRGRIDHGIFDSKEYARAIRWVEQNCKEGRDYNPRNKQKTRRQLNKEKEFSVKTGMVVRDLMVGNPALARLGFLEQSLGHNAIAAGFQGQRGWTDYNPNGDLLEAVLNSSFDWNGIRAPYIVATENDSLNGVAMLFGYLLTNSAQIFADVRSYWSPEAIMRVTGRRKLDERIMGGILHLINSGPAALDGTGQQEKDGRPAMKPYWEITPQEVEKCLGATTWHPADVVYFPGGGWSTRYTTKDGMPVTMTRINLVKGLGPMLQIAEGYTLQLPQDVHDILDNRTNPTWPTTWFALKPSKPEFGTAFTEEYNTMSEWGANHGALSYGHIGPSLITLAAMLRIPVAMHNVDESDIFRPSAWSAFGTKDREGADYRACQNFGPLYSKIGK